MKQIRLIVILVLLGCHPDKSTPVLTEQITFRMTDASELFFKNIRRSEYEVVENAQAGIDTYVLNDLETHYSGSSPTLLPKLVINWRQDMAYVMLSSQPLNAIDTLIIGQENTVVFNESNIKDHAFTALKIYNAILESQPIEVLSKGSRKPLFESLDYQNDFRIVVFDYLRLVEIR